MRRAFSAVAVVVSTVLASIMVASPASAISRVSCSNVNALHTYSVSGDTCWAYKGTAYVTLYKVSGFWTGNFSGTYVWEYAGTGDQHVGYFQSGTYHDGWAKPVTIRRITIW